MKDLQLMLSGKKTYIIAGLMILIALVNLVSGDITIVEFIESDDMRILLEGLGLGALRAGVGKLE